ncbi:MAG: RDD family protein [Chlamydiia bacterium]|nr:RDD family protein [Chlamydiia bacterium]
MKTVEPTEILVGKEKREKEHSHLATPWIRFLGRFFDYALWIAALWLLHKIFGGGAPFAHYERFIPYEFFTWIPIEAILLYSWGTTPGKWLLRAQIVQGRRKRLDISSAFRRSFFVWFRGLGMMIPVLNFLCLIIAYQRLKLLRFTSWDRDENTQVLHEQIAGWRITVAIIVIVFTSLFIYFPSQLNS